MCIRTNPVFTNIHYHLKKAGLKAVVKQKRPFLSKCIGGVAGLCKYASMLDCR